MKTILGMLVVLCAAGLAACGDTGSSVVGTWVLDGNATFEANRAAFMRDMDAGFEKAKAGLEEMNRELAKVPEAQRAEALKAAREQAFALAGEHRDLAEAFLRSPEEARKLTEKKARQQIEKMSVRLTVKGDNTYASTAEMGTNKEEASGTWSLAGDQLTFQPKQKGGKALSGGDAKPQVATIKGDVLTIKPGENAPTFFLKKQ